MAKTFFPEPNEQTWTHVHLPDFVHPYFLSWFVLVVLRLLKNGNSIKWESHGFIPKNGNRSETQFETLLSC